MRILTDPYDPEAWAQKIEPGDEEEMFLNFCINLYNRAIGEERSA